MRNLYHTFFWGPFDTLEDLTQAVILLDEVSPGWDYNPFCVVRGSNPLPRDYVGGLDFISKNERTALEKTRKDAKDGKTFR